MSETKTSAKTPPLGLDKLTLVLNGPTRWILLRELSKGEPLPIQELARRTGRSSDAISKHMAVLRRLGVAVVGFGRLYSLAPTFRPAPGTNTIDFGYCTVHLDALASAK